ncbi:MAG: glycosyltransferase family 4 protein [Gemmatimonadaceae bacterium]
MVLLNSTSIAGAIAGIASFGLAFLLVAVVRRLALNAGMIDIPGIRSSHVRPTARGGGAAIILAVAMVGGVCVASDLVPRLSPPIAVTCVVAIFGVAVVGWVDDRRGVSVSSRLVVHVAAAGLVAGAVVSGQPFGGAACVIILAASTLAGVAAINIINFMDGIDGLVASTVVLYNIYVLMIVGTSHVLGWGALLVGAASCGFLLWNWPPAKVFLGDVGSGTLGLIMAFEGAALVTRFGVSVAAAFLPLVPVVADAMFTILQRISIGENLTTPHRKHLYQRLANGGWGHGRVATLYACATAAGVGIGLRWGDSLLTCGAYAAAVLAVGTVLHRSAPAVNGSVCS